METFEDPDEWDGTGTFAQVRRLRTRARGRAPPSARARARRILICVVPVSASQHAVSGSIAGLLEHSLMFPVDTIKTTMQVRQGTPMALAAEGAMGGGPSMLASLEHLTASGGHLRMWRGVQTMFTGCVPAHAAYFSIYEGCKARFSRDAGASAGATASASAMAAEDGSPSGESASGGASESGAGGSASPVAAGAAVVLATMAHDIIMTPMDCIKQRLQLGHHKNSLVECARCMLQEEGPRAFLRSYPTTLLMNVPYALVMGSSNEAIRGILNPSGAHSFSTYLIVR